MRGLPAFLSNQWSWPHETTVMDSRSSERKRSSFTTSDILDTMPISLFPQLPPSPTCSDVWQAVSNYDDTPDNVSGHRKEHPSNPSVDADSLRNTEQGIYFIITHVWVCMAQFQAKNGIKNRSIFCIYLSIYAIQYECETECEHGLYAVSILKQGYHGCIC